MVREKQLPRRFTVDLRTGETKEAKKQPYSMPPQEKKPQKDAAEMPPLKEPELAGTKGELLFNPKATLSDKLKAADAVADVVIKDPDWKRANAGMALLTEALTDSETDSDAKQAASQGLRKVIVLAPGDREDIVKSVFDVLEDALTGEAFTYETNKWAGAALANSLVDESKPPLGRSIPSGRGEKAMRILKNGLKKAETITDEKRRETVSDIIKHDLNYINNAKKLFDDIM
ncbi:MAG: hypothetical protein V1921_02575 [Candidatus Altiarchaeota archaeon]